MTLPPKPCYNVEKLPSGLLQVTRLAGEPGHSPDEVERLPVDTKEIERFIGRLQIYECHDWSNLREVEGAVVILKAAPALLYVKGDVTLGERSSTPRLTFVDGDVTIYSKANQGTERKTPISTLSRVAPRLIAVSGGISNHYFGVFQYSLHPTLKAVGRVAAQILRGADDLIVDPQFARRIGIAHLQLALAAVSAAEILEDTGSQDAPSLDL